jgi:capsid protein
LHPTPPVSIPPASTQTSTQITQRGVIFNNNVEEVKEVKIIATQAISVREEVVVNQTGVLFTGPVTSAEAKVSQLVGDITTLWSHEVEEVDKAEQVRGTLAFLRAPDSPLLDRNMSKPILTSVN